MHGLFLGFVFCSVSLFVPLACYNYYFSNISCLVYDRICLKNIPLLFLALFSCTWIIRASYNVPKNTYEDVYWNCSGFIDCFGSVHFFLISSLSIHEDMISSFQSLYLVFLRLENFLLESSFVPSPPLFSAQLTLLQRCLPGTVSLS